MSIISSGLKSFANKSLNSFNNVAAQCRSRVATRLNHSYRYTRINCKKLGRRIKQKACAITERNQLMAQETYERNIAEQRQRAEETNNQNLTMMLFAFMMMFEAQRPTEIFEYHAKAPSPDLGSPELA